MSETQLSLSFYDDAALKKMPETDIIDAILGRHAPLERDIMPAAMAAVGAAIQSTAGLGQLLEEIYQRHKGGKWEEVYAKLNMPFTFVQANRFRQQWVNRDKVIFASEPSPLALTNAYRHAELYRNRNRSRKAICLRCRSRSSFRLTLREKSTRGEKRT